VGDPFRLARREGGAILPGGVSDFGYHTYVFLDGPHDLFSLRQRTAVAFAAGAGVGLTGYYDTYLLIGPVTPGEDAFSIAEWNMNAVQFEYGVIAATPIGGFNVALEYGRTSQHPLRGGYSEVSADILEIAVYGPRFHLSRSSWDVGVRAAWLDLFDLWQSPLLAPRTAARFELPVAGSASIAILPGLEAVWRLWPRLILTRVEDAWPYADTRPRVQTELDAEAGIRFSRHSALEILIELFRTADSEQLRGEPAPLATLGIVVRMATR
jgi:hypothetical protein